MKRKWIMLFCLCLVFLVVVAARYSRYQPPQWIELISADSWAWRVSDSSDVVRFQIDTDGTPNVYNSSGTKIWGVSALGANESLNRETPTALTWVAGTGFSITLTESASLYTFDVSTATSSSANNVAVMADATAGATIVLPTPTAALDGAMFTILKTDTGTTAACIYAAGLPFGTASAVTDIRMDAQADCMTLMCDYDSAVSYWVISDNLT